VLSDAQIQAAAALLDERFGLDALYLYGSEAAERARVDSDVDFAILARRRITAPERLALASELAVLLGRDVDLVVLDEVSPILRMQVLRNGRRVFASAPTRAAELEARSFSEYADLKRVRAAAERALIERIHPEGAGDP
jgi:uncharacterized protein